MNAINLPQQQEEHVHSGHVTAVLFVAVLLVGVSWLKNQQLFSVFKKSQAALANSQDVPKYYAYVTPQQDELPLVAGDTTQNTGPSIINEDGSITPAVDAGSVLGASTGASDAPISLSSIHVIQIPDSSAAMQAYIAAAHNARGSASRACRSVAACSGVTIRSRFPRIAGISSPLVGFTATSPRAHARR